MTQFADSLYLADLDGADGFRLYGTESYAYAGYSVASAGDIDGDGFTDVIIGAPGGDTVYVVFGGQESLDGLDAADTSPDGAALLSNLDGVNGFSFTTDTYAGIFLGLGASGAGDVNGDGFDDFSFGSPIGLSLVIFGTDAGFNAEYDDDDLGAIDGSSGYILGDSYGALGGAISSAGDIDGDGFDDIIFGTPYSASFDGQNGAFVIFGDPTNLSALDNADSSEDGVIDVTLVDGTTGFFIYDANLYSNAGISVSGAGDVDGDGFDDVLIGAPGDAYYGYADSGAYLVFGTDTAFSPGFDLADIDGNNGYKFNGVADYDAAGVSVGVTGDVNADGFDDLVVGAVFAEANYSGAAYIVFGSSANLAALDLADSTTDGAIELSELDGNNGFKVTGVAAYDWAGFAVSSAGDVNGDGFDDIVIGAPRVDDVGFAYVVFGAAGGFAPSIDLGALDGNDGFIIVPEVDEDGYGTGISVSSAGDMNGDGFADIIVGAYYSYVGGDAAGAAYIIYGHKPDDAVTRNGTSIANTIHGSDFNDTLNGRGKPDTLIGHDGNDHLLGGGGPDRLIGGAGADRLGGLLGPDTFVYEQVSDSAEPAFDRIRTFDGAVDKFDLWFTVTGVDATVSARFVDIDTALDAGHLAANHAVVMLTPGVRDYLVVDVNGIDGYQSGADLIIALTNGQNLEQIDTGSFI